MKDRIVAITLTPLQIDTLAGSHCTGCQQFGRDAELLGVGFT
jgi:hypothetical protein